MDPVRLLLGSTMSELDPALHADLERLCEAALKVITSDRSRRPLPDPEIRAVLAAIADRLVAAGVDGQIAWNTTTRWFITTDPIDCALAVESDPPYDTTRSRPGTAGPGRS